MRRIKWRKISVAKVTNKGGQANPVSSVGPALVKEELTLWNFVAFLKTKAFMATLLVVITNIKQKI